MTPVPALTRGQCRSRFHRQRYFLFLLPRSRGPSRPSVDKFADRECRAHIYLARDDAARIIAVDDTRVLMTGENSSARDHAPSNRLPSRESSSRDSDGPPVTKVSGSLKAAGPRVGLLIDIHLEERARNLASRTGHPDTYSKPSGTRWRNKSMSLV